MVLVICCQRGQLTQLQLTKLCEDEVENVRLLWMLEPSLYVTLERQACQSLQWISSPSGNLQKGPLWSMLVLVTTHGIQRPQLITYYRCIHFQHAQESPLSEQRKPPMMMKIVLIGIQGTWPILTLSRGYHYHCSPCLLNVIDELSTRYIRCDMDAGVFCRLYHH